MANIKLTNGVKIDQDSLDISSFTGVDTSNIIATQVGLKADYMAPQDCWFFIHQAANQGCNIKINGVDVLIYNYYNTHLVPLKKDQVIYLSQTSNMTTKVFGLNQNH